MIKRYTHCEDAFDSFEDADGEWVLYEDHCAAIAVTTPAPADDVRAALVEHELLPCPFCGGTDGDIAGAPDRGYWAMCDSCGASTSEINNRTEADAIAAWNRRALATHAPQTAEPSTLARAMQWGSLYDAASRLIAAIGYHGSSRDGEVLWLQECLRVLDDGEHMPGLMPAPHAPAAQPLTPDRVFELALEAGFEGDDGSSAQGEPKP